MGCNLCNSGSIGVKWTRDLKIGSKSLRAAALEFNMTIEEVMEHMQTHVMEEPEPETDIMTLLEDPKFINRKILSIALNIEDWAKYVQETEKLDKNTMEFCLKLFKELRELYKLQAELEGKLKRGDTYQQQFIQIQGDMNMLVGTVLSEMCPACQMKIVQNQSIMKYLSSGDHHGQ